MVEVCPDAGARPDDGPEPRAAPGPYSRPELLQMFEGMRRMTTTIERFHGRVADRLGLAVNEIIILSLVDHPTSTTPTELAAALGRNASTITAAIDRLEAAGLVTRRRHPEDRRKTVLSLSGDGRAAMGWLRGVGEEGFGALDTETLATMAAAFTCAADVIDGQIRAIAT